jgi:hypothetical protein
LGFLVLCYSETIFSHHDSTKMVQSQQAGWNVGTSFLHLFWIWCEQVILCGLIGIPPSNGVIPQSPMHTKSLATLKHQVIAVQVLNYLIRMWFVE